jgi:hypothetical protein
MISRDPVCHRPFRSIDLGSFPQHTHGQSDPVAKTESRLSFGQCGEPTKPSANALGFLLNSHTPKPRKKPLYFTNRYEPVFSSSLKINLQRQRRQLLRRISPVLQGRNCRCLTTASTTAAKSLWQRADAFCRKSTPLPCMMALAVVTAEVSNQ